MKRLLLVIALGGVSLLMTLSILTPQGARASVDGVTAINANVIADFEGAVPAGWFQYSDGDIGLAFEVITVTDSMTNALPGQVGDNGVLSATANIPTWGGFGAALTDDWSGYDAVSFWYYGQNLSTTHEFEIQTVAGDDRRATFVDDFEGWRQIVLPFQTFGAGGVYDVSAVDNWVFVLDGTVGSFLFDDLQVVSFELVADFEGAVPAGWFQYSDGDIGLSFETITMTESLTNAIPGQVGDNGVLSATANIPTWGGFGAAVTEDWSDQHGIGFWYYGQNLSTTHEFEIQTVAGDDRRATFVDDFEGWKYIALPFTTFGDGSSYDVSAVDNWVFVLDGTVGSFLLDDVGPYGGVNQSNLTVSLDSNSYSVTEGESVSITVSLNTTTTNAVTVTVNSSDASATAGSDYTAVSQSIVIDPGESSASLTLSTVDDSDVEGSETLTVTISAPISAELGAISSAQVTINDDDVAEAANMIADFEGAVPAGWFQYSDGDIGLAFEVITVTDSMTNALPGQVGDNGVLSATANIPTWGGFGAALTDDWSGYDAVSFWYYGQNLSTTHEFEIQTVAGDDRRATFVDDFEGWRQIVLPFQTFGAGGVYDVSAVDNWVFVLDGTVGSFLFDDLQVVSFELVADFEGAVPAGWFQYSDGDTGLSFETITMTESMTNAIPGQVGDNGVLSATANIPTWGGFGAAVTEDWSDQHGIGFWYYGQNLSTTHEFEIQTVAGDDRRATFVDDFEGWKYIALPFTTFGDGSSYDVSAVDNWVFVLDGTVGSFLLDDVGPYGCPEDDVLSVEFDSDAYVVAEGDAVTLTVSLNMTSTDAVTVSVGSSDGTAEAGIDYTAVSETVVIAAGDMSASVVVSTTDDSSIEDGETFNVSLSSPISAELGTDATAVVTISDDDSVPGSKGSIVEDFEIDELPFVDVDGTGIGWVVWQDGGGSIAITTTTTADAGIDAVDGKDGTNKVLEIDANIAAWGGLTHAFENGALDEWINQDWSSYESIGFWYYGEGDGTTVFFDISENRNPNPNNDGAERWRLEWTDDTAGWQYIESKFEDFNRNALYNEAPNDGWSGEEVHGWSFGTLATGGADKRYLDDIKLIPRVSTIEDFEISELPFVDVDGIGIGWVVWQDGGGSIEITTTTTTDAGIAAIDGKDGTNQVLEIDANIAAWGGLTHAFENEALDEWISQDWSGYEGICFWYYGEGDGTTVFFDISENRNPNDNNDGAERWRHEWTDDTAGWQFIQVAFEDFNRNALYNEAPNDGWSGAEVHGWSFGTLSTGGADKRYLDDIVIYGNSGTSVDLLVDFADGTFSVTEGGTAAITVELTISTTEDVTVDYMVGESQAVLDRDHEAVSGTLTIPAGDSSATIDFVTIDDDKYEKDENVVLILSNATGAEMGFQQRTLVTIEDDMDPDPAMVHDFEAFHSFLSTSGDVEITPTEIVSTSAMARPGQGNYEYVAQIEFDSTIAGRVANASSTVEISQTFVVSEDWSSYDGLNFYFMGSGSGETYTVNILDNQMTTTADLDSDEWIMVWNDEFDGVAGTAPNPNNWKYELGDGFINSIQGWGNSELQYYTDSTDNAALDGSGNLKLTMLDVNTTTTELLCWYGPCEYTSARLISQDRMEYEYGRIETSILVPDGPAGLWPAFWTLGTDINDVGWPQTGEIDIMEYVSRLPNEVFGTIHGPGYSGGDSYGEIVDLGVPVADEYHTYAINWSPDRIEWYLDGNLYHTAVPADVAPNEWVYNHPFFLLMNMAVGGNFGGAPDAGLTFPQDMLVDYVRVYQGTNTSERFEATFVDNTAGWQQVHLSFENDFARSSDQPVGAPDDGLTLTEMWGYTIEMPENTSDTVYIDRVYLGAETMYIQYLPIINR